MKRLIETAGDGMESHLEEKVTLFCINYIYTGVLSGVNDADVELIDAKIVYETGELNSGEWKDAQLLPSPWNVRTAAIESWGKAKC
jgi:hypothetical protein